MRRSATLGLLAMSSVAMSTWVCAQEIPDHLKCYRIKDPLGLKGVVDVDTPQFGADAGCAVSKAKLFCVPASKVVQSAKGKRTGTITPLPVTGVPTTDDRVCYALKCAAQPADQEITDQFGTRRLDLGKSAYVCTPAVKGTEYCGDGARNGVEECDGADLGGACGSAGFTSGAVACGAACRLDTSGCTCGGGDGGRFPATGQTTCWDAAGSVIACAGTGHDGEIQAGAMLVYTDNGDGTITDAATGLMWEKLADDGGIHDKDNLYTWDDAFAVKLAALNGVGGFAGHTDWRVPNVKELQSIVNYEAVDPAVSAAFNTGCTGGCMVTTCSCTASTYHWSSSTYALAPAYAWRVIFSDALVSAGYKPDDFSVRAVRGGM
jgi:hypothetical protein